ncbi:MAG: hypothetical protein BIFFINMI_03094 [Phycisphaerae bacterium]|nr:hypothetical protein [Phycisphaerae bacterium]
MTTTSMVHLLVLVSVLVLFALAGCQKQPGDVMPSFATDLSVHESAGRDRPAMPVTFGLPLARGELTDGQIKSLRLVIDGEPVQADFSAVAHWKAAGPDQPASVCWLHCNTILPPVSAWGRLRLRIDNHQWPKYPPAIDYPCSLDFDPSLTQAMADNGPVRLRVEGNGGAIFSQLQFNRPHADRHTPNLLTGSGPALVVQADGKTWRSELDSHSHPAVLHQSACKLVLSTSGTLKGPGGIRGLDYQVITTLYSGSAAIRLQVTLTNRQGLEPEDKTTLQDAWLELPTKFGPEATARVGQVGPPLETVAAATPQILAASSESYATTCTNVDTGKARTGDGGLPRRDHPVGIGWVDVTAPGGKAGLACGMRDFWQTCPRALAVTREGSIRVGLFAGSAAGGKSQDLYFGVARTTEMTLLPHGPDTDAAELAKFFIADQEPLLPLAAPARYCQQTKVYGPVVSADADFGRFAPIAHRYDQAAAASLSKILARQDGVVYNQVLTDAYGWLNYGDTFHWAFPGVSAADAKTVIRDPSPEIIQWDAGHYDYPWAMILQGLRTGDEAFIRRGLCGAQYGMDVHTVHVAPSDPRNGASRYCPAVNHVGTETAAPAMDKRMDWLTGLSTIARWQLLGDFRAAQVAEEIYQRAAGSRVEQEGWDSPRGPGNQISILLAAWQMTGQDAYLERAQKVAAMAGRVVAQSADFPDKPENRYRYGIGLEGLVRLAALTDTPSQELVHTIQAVVDTALDRKLKGYSPNMAAAVGFCYRQTGDLKYLAVLMTLLRDIEVTSRTKYFGCFYRPAPIALYYLQQAGLKKE